MIIKSFFRKGVVEENSFLLIDEQTGTTAIFDPSYEDVSILIQVPRIDYIFLTHGHYDHTASVKFIKEKYKSKIICHKDEKELLENPSLNLSGLFGNVITTNPDIVLDDMEIFKVGNLEIKCIHTPGHTKGSCCYMVENHIFTGDTVMAGTIGRTDLPTGNYNQIIGSVNKLKKIDNDYVLHCGHGGDTKLSIEKKINMYFR